MSERKLCPGSGTDAEVGEQVCPKCGLLVVVNFAGVLADHEAPT